MSAIQVDRNPDPSLLERLEVGSWPEWTMHATTFPWVYDNRESCYFLEGDVVVTPDGGEPVRIGKGALATFAAGLVCTWEIRQPVKKRYAFDVDL